MSDRPKVGKRWRGVTAIATYRGDGYVTKKYRASCDKCVARETKALVLLGSSAHSPDLIRVDGNSLDITYAGERATAANIPKDVEEQCQGFLDDMAKAGLVHRDIMPGNLLVLDGVLMVIDYGWCVPVEDVNQKAPGGLGDRFRSKDGFDDKYSLDKSIAHIKSGG